MVIIHIDTVESFKKETEGEDKVVILDFWAPWCGPCRMLGPIFEEISDDYSDVVFAKVNVDEAQELAGQFNIMSIPTLLIVKGGEVVDQQMGALSKEQLKDFINKNK